MKKLLMAVIAAAALSLPVTASYAAAPTGNIVVAANERHHGVHYRNRTHQNWNRSPRVYQNWGRDNRQPDAWRGRYPTGFVGHPHWSRGDRLYRAYWTPRYYVNDWRVYDLRSPPYGYRWVRVNDAYILVSVRTGIILDVVMRN
ncbi:MAG TPA: RcnB family protein [Rhizomicrobium sp.]|nr:RcnB family protein [Rhizomicrobium sp.]